VDLILDTNALSAAADGDTDIAARFSAANRVGIPVIVLGEYRFGIFQSRRRREYEQWLADTISATRVFEISEATTLHYAAIRVELKRVGKPIPSNDLWIAALCREHRCHLLSRDLHFDCVPRLRRLGW
jgi:tRNA(fMet)-specific endonuclease VapC